MSTAAIIPARGGSKGIPRKNIQPLCGKPLICWTIEAAKRAKLIDHVIVSTDDDEIARISLGCGADVIRRPDALSTDISSSEEALLHALQNVHEKPELIVFLQCTSPLTTCQDIDKCIKTLIDTGADSAFTATESHRFLWKNAESARAINHGGANRKRRQDIEKEFAENGAVYVMRTAGFLEARDRFFGRTVISEMPAARTWEIDSPDDLQIAAALMALRHGEGILPDIVAAVIFDFDGVMTDNAVYVSEDGKESVRCDRGDGWGISRLQEAGIRTAVMSTEANGVVRARCRKLGLECFHHLGDRKIDKLRSWTAANGLDIRQVVYIGNDENDVQCLLSAGLGVAPADAHPSAKTVADMILNSCGGHGAVRELCDLILKKVQK